MTKFFLNWMPATPAKQRDEWMCLCRDLFLFERVTVACYVAVNSRVNRHLRSKFQAGKRAFGILWLIHNDLCCAMKGGPGSAARDRGDRSGRLRTRRCGPRCRQRREGNDDPEDNYDGNDSIFVRKAQAFETGRGSKPPIARHPGACDAAPAAASADNNAPCATVALPVRRGADGVFLIAPNRPRT